VVTPYLVPSYSPWQEAATRRSMRRVVGRLSTGSLLTELVSDARFIATRDQASSEGWTLRVLRLRMVRNELRRRGETTDLHPAVSRWQVLPVSRKV